MNPELEKLQTQKEKTERLIAQCEHRETLMKNRIAYLDRGERKKRAHRLITRGAAVESISPAVKSMSETDFYELMETILTLPEVILRIPVEWSARSGGTARPFQNERRGAPLIRASAISRNHAC